MGRPGGAGAVQLAGERVVQDLVDERALARAADAGDGDERAEREVGRRCSCRLCWRAPMIVESQRATSPTSAGLRRSAGGCVGTGIAFLPDRYCPVSDAFDFEHLLRRALRR